METELKKLGLSPNEIQVYLKILKLGSTTAGPIISSLKLHRQSVYNALDELEQKELLVKTTRNKVNHYRVNDPKILVDNLKKQELIAARLSKQIKEQMKSPVAEEKPVEEEPEAELPDETAEEKTVEEEPKTKDES